MHFKQLTIMVNNIDESIKFYEIMTELTLSRRSKEGPGEIAFLANGDGETEIELVCMPQMQKFEGKGFFLCFMTDNLDAKYEFAKAQGLNPSDIRKPDDETRYFYVYDPDGVSVQLKQKR